jgi:hypothetical protein
LACHVSPIDLVLAWQGARRGLYLRMPGCRGCARPPYRACLPTCSARLVGDRLDTQIGDSRLTRVGGLAPLPAARRYAAWPSFQARDLAELPALPAAQGRLTLRWRGGHCVALFELVPPANTPLRLLRAHGWRGLPLALAEPLPTRWLLALLPTWATALQATLLATAAQAGPGGLSAASAPSILSVDQPVPSAPSVPSVLSVPSADQLRATCGLLPDPATLWDYDDSLGLPPMPTTPAIGAPLEQGGAPGLEQEAIPRELVLSLISALPNQVATARLLGEALEQEGYSLSRAERGALITRLQRAGLLATAPYRGQRGAFQLDLYGAKEERQP